MNTRDVASWVKQNGVVTMKADFTNKDPVIAEALTELGNVGLGLPFYAIYPADGGPPIVFDGLVSKRRILDELAKAAGTVSAAKP